MLQTRPRFCPMGICALRLLVLLVSGPLTLAAFASGLAQPVASAKNVGEECGISIQLHMDTHIEKDAGAPPAICSLVEVPRIPSPFVNSLMVVPWSGLASLKVNDQPLEDFGFYRLSPDRTARYSGRPSYDDPRSGYRQKVLSTSKTNLKRGANKTEIHRTELRVHWLRPLDARQSEEVSQEYVCVDAASKDERGVLLLNWCELRSDRERVATLQNGGRSLARVGGGNK